jgi:polysaccharide pyruvyl transferase WcaK-like protein
MSARRFVIINQHGENRGDEAAMRAMIRAIDAHFPGSSFTVVAQFRDRHLRVPFQDQDVTFAPMLLPIPAALALTMYAALATLGIRSTGWLPSGARAIANAVKGADLVINAPGGPYFGDTYAGHELAHWFFVWLARLHRKAVFQYAPSCGPFRIRPMNWLRRRFYRWIDVLVVREEISRDHLAALLGPHVPIHVTIDSAIQDVVPPITRERYFSEHRRHLRNRFLVAVTVQRYRFPGVSNAADRQAEFERVVLGCLEHLAERTSCHFLFFPQLYGAVHSDVPFHRSIGSRLPAGVSWEIVDPGADSDRQRALFGMVDFCVASRYHPQIFATTQAVPGLFIAYEHKQLGYLRLLGLERYLFDIRRLDAAAMKRAIDEALQRRGELSAMLHTRIPQLQRVAATTTQLLVQFMTGGEKGITNRAIPATADGTV